MKYRTLGKEGMDVSVISLGTWQLAESGYWGEGGDPDEAVRAALDAGINLFDSAESYVGGESEKVLGRALGSDRDRVFIATKVSPGNCSAEKMRASCEASLKRLGTDHIDLYQVHWPPRDISFAETWGEMQKLRQEGKIREIGVSNFGRRDIGEWLDCGNGTASNQLGYNMLFRAIEYKIVPACMDADIGILTYMPLMQGLLAGIWKTPDEVPPARSRTRHFSGEREGARHGEKGEEQLTFKVLDQLREVAEDTGESMAAVALAWCIAQPGITSVIVGGRKPEQITRNLTAAERELDRDTMERINAITEPLKLALGPCPDMWESPADARSR